MKNILLKILPDLAAVIFFVAVSVLYMFPAMSGKTLAQHDSTAGIGLGKETSDYFAATGERSRWTNSAFSGMPTYQSAPSYPAPRILGKVQRLYRLYLPDYVWYLFVLLIGFYILMRVMGYSVLLSTLGGIAWAFSSYFFIIISAGHIWKVTTLAYIPPTIAGMVLIYKKKYVWGSVLCAIFTAFQIASNHVQMTYYFLFVMAAFIIVYAVEASRKRELKQFLLSSFVLVGASLVGIAVNSSNLYHTYQYSKETMRGGSELVSGNDSNHTASGLDRDYITQWSYGIGETFSLIVPNVKGGATVKGDDLLSIAQNRTAMKKADKRYVQIYRQLPQYWGEQPMTSGPVYVGALFCLLFILALLIVRGPVKWALLAVTILSILLSWGHNLQWFTDLFIDYMPMYSKFRTVSSILVIAEFTIPLLGVMGLSEYLKAGREGRLGERSYLGGTLSAQAALIVSLCITGGICFLLFLFPSILGPAVSSGELQMLTDFASSSGSALDLDDFLANLSEVRYAILTSDALRSLAIIAVGFLMVFLSGKGKIKQPVTLLLLTALCLVDMWSVNKRYLSDDMFKSPKAKESSYQMTETDELILQDGDLDYRVLNLASNTFNENRTSYFHKSIGGYHPAKLRRYNDVIERYITPQMNALFDELVKTSGDLSLAEQERFSIINMLNARYFIVPVQGNETIPVINPYAFGNGWFVSSVKYVDGAQQEIDSIGQIDLRSTAVVDGKFAAKIGQPSEGQLPFDPQSSVELVDYKPNKLSYEVSSATGGLLVLSEIYYPGWKAEVDGEPVEIGRADYILRALAMPAGKHRVNLSFDPTSLHITDTLSLIALSLMALGFVAALAFSVRKRLKKKLL